MEFRRGANIDGCGNFEVGPRRGWAQRYRADNAQSHYNKLPETCLYTTHVSHCLTSSAKTGPSIYRSKCHAKTPLPPKPPLVFKTSHRQIARWQKARLADCESQRVKD